MLNLLLPIMNRLEVSLKLAPLMPDEHIFSGLIRSYLLSGYKDLANGFRGLSIKVNYPLKAEDVFSDDFAKLISHYCRDMGYQPNILLKEHSLYSIFSVGSPFSYCSNINNAFKSGRSAYAGLWRGRQDLAYSKSWKFCESCVKEDVEKFGVSYWHCSHQLPTVSTCISHQKILLLANNIKNEGLKNLNQTLLPHQIIKYSFPMEPEYSSQWDEWLVTLFHSLKSKQCFYAQDAKSKIFSYLDLPKKNLLPEDVQLIHLKFDQRLLEPKLLPYEITTVNKNKSLRVLKIIEKLLGYKTLSNFFKFYSPDGRVNSSNFKDITREPLTNIEQRIDHPIPYLVLLFAIRLCPETLVIRYE